MPKKEKQPEPEPIPAHVHIWDILDVQTPPATLHPRLSGNTITFVLIRCKECNVPQTLELEGTWTLEQILRNDARIVRPDGNESA
jgi:hypothetical protein